MKVTVKRILTDIEQEVTELEEIYVKKKKKKIAPSTKQLIVTVDRSQLLKNAHIMVCNAFDEQSIFDK